MGTKYNGLIAFFLLTLFVPFIHSRYAGDNKASAGQSLRYGALFFPIALLIFAPWMIRNYIWTGNPLYPLYDAWFNPEHPIHRQTIGLFTYRSAVYHEQSRHIALLPIRIFFEGQDGDPLESVGPGSSSQDAAREASSGFLLRCFLLFTIL